MGGGGLGILEKWGRNKLLTKKLFLEKKRTFFRSIFNNILPNMGKIAKFLRCAHFFCEFDSYLRHVAPRKQGSNKDPENWVGGFISIFGQNIYH